MRFANILTIACAFVREKEKESERERIPGARLKVNMPSASFKMKPNQKPA